MEKTGCYGLPILKYGSIDWPIAGLEMVLEGQSISYSCNNGFKMDAGADNQIYCRSDGTLSGTLSSKNIQCNSSLFSLHVYCLVLTNKSH